MFSPFLLSFSLPSPVLLPPFSLPSPSLLPSFSPPSPPLLLKVVFAWRTYSCVSRSSDPRYTKHCHTKDAGPLVCGIIMFILDIIFCIFVVAMGWEQVRDV